MTFWDFFWLMISFVLYVSYLVVLVLIVKDLFADSNRSGWSKAIWVLVLIFLPVFGGLAYLIAHGQSMSLRQAARTDAARDDFDGYLRRTAGTNPAEQIAQAKTLMDDGTLTAEEFTALKQRVLRQ
ncbi:high-affinity K+ transport system ATPase subunit B [Arthrobacter ginsengisoli]|uniref:High-affinity K+ transport system ATPase subunit B n=1 Tax=Arthrobacter ginsengisoli TaxID=1356565 RepID=A0ABU1UC33_9MICC|nr:PLD nuclease N-terminal domain-containing protein [Arthrobacter ginsengisoli]MDR7082767.1 high-affinity K+ transport system ATPase subunit B [Arthrobacter ginsengisoli]